MFGDGVARRWDSDWAGGTEGSDIRIAKEFDVDRRKINLAKEIANELFPLERAVTPFSESAPGGPLKIAPQARSFVGEPWHRAVAEGSRADLFHIGKA